MASVSGRNNGPVFNSKREMGLSAHSRKVSLQRSKKWLVRGLVKFTSAVARLVCPDLLG